MKGYIDRFDSTIAGWVFDPTLPGQAADIIVEYDGAELYRCVADLLREDLVPVIGEGYHGFMFDPLVSNGFDKDMQLKVYAVTNRKHLLYDGKWHFRKNVIEGVDNWLFLNEDSNKVNLRISGKIDFEPERIYRNALQFAFREAFMMRLGIPYLPVILPEKNVVCARFFPGIEISENRPVRLIRNQLERFGCRIFYPIEEFLASPVDVFYRTDTHFNTAGYNIIFDLLKKELPGLFGGITLPVPYLNKRFCGDLGNKLFPPQIEEVEEYVHPASKDHFYNRDNIHHLISRGEKIRGEVVSVLNRRAEKRLLIFGTSSAYHLLPIVSQGFSQTLLVWENTFDFRIVELFKPDCVLWLPSERFFPFSIDDLTGLPKTMEAVRQII